MQLSDLTLLARKILVGIVITVVPLGILTGGLWITQKTLKKNAKPIVVQSGETSHAN
jgi:ethanolamine transporter EutH